MDTVSHLVRMAQLDAHVDKRCLLGGSTRMDVAAYGERQAAFHVLLDGSCTLEVGSIRRQLEPGDVVVVPSGSPHRITTPGTRELRGTRDTIGDAFATTRSAVRSGSAGSAGSRAAVIDLFCGHYSFGPGAGALLLDSLPEPLQVSFGQSEHGAGMLRTLSGLMRGEAQHEGDGTEAILAALCSVILTMVLRTGHDVATSAALWTAGADPRITPVIEEVLRAPGEDWSIERMSRHVAMSRATFLRRFARATNMTAGTFVRQARMMTAAHLLATTDQTVSSVAGRVGFESESAFSKAFRAATGSTPAQFRRAQGGRTGGRPEPGPARGR
jgi:AraC-like DNA-binding protein